MKTILKLMAPIGLALLAGCVIIPVGPPRPYYRAAYYGPAVRVVAPAPVFAFRP